MPLVRNPLIYEINTWVWLADLSAQHGQPITLATVPAETLDALGGLRVHAVWLMGVWQRSPQGRAIARTHPGLQMEYEHALPDFTAADVVGSPYAVQRYRVDAVLGGPDGLRHFRQELAVRGLRLILDYVPNHVAVDHHWTHDCPDCLVQGTPADLENRPTYYFRAADSANSANSADSPNSATIFAHGRDPYYPAWTDTAQVNAFSPTARENACALLLDIADQCDGVRCDMAMLMVNRIFMQTWAIEDQPATEFWQDVIPAVKQKHADFTFMAEVYWDMEGELQTLGFDYTYDKRLYDRMRDQHAGGVRDHLLAALAYQQKMVRFIENHDEPRALTAFGLERSQAAAALVCLLPGAHLLHDGQFEGRRLKLPVQLGRHSTETRIDALVTFYEALLTEASQAVYRDGVYMALAANPVLSRMSGPEALIAFAWALADDWRVVVVNFSAERVEARLMLPYPALATLRTWEFTDALSGASELHLGSDLLTSGLPVQLAAYGVSIWRMNRSASGGQRA